MVLPFVLSMSLFVVVIVIAAACSGFLGSMRTLLQSVVHTGRSLVQFSVFTHDREGIFAMVDG